MLFGNECRVSAYNETSGFQQLPTVAKKLSHLIVGEMVQDSEKQDAIEHARGDCRNFRYIGDMELTIRPIFLPSPFDVRRVVIDSHIMNIAEQFSNSADTTSNVQNRKSCPGLNNVSSEKQI